MDPAAQAIGVFGDVTSLAGSMSAFDPVAATIKAGTYAALGGATCYVLGGRPLYGIIGGFVGGEAGDYVDEAVFPLAGLGGYGGAIGGAAALAYLYPGRRR